MNIAGKIADRLVVLTQYRLSAGHYGYNYQSGYYGGGAKHPGGISGDGQAVILDHRRLRQNARRAYQENLIARSVVDRYTETVADAGLKREFSPDTETLKISPKTGEAWRTDAGNRFHLWAFSKKCHRSETMNLYQAQRLYAASQQRDNDIFVRFYYSNRRDLQSPLQFDFVDPEQIVGDAITTSAGYFNQRDGIIKDSANKELGYKIRVKINGKTEKRTIAAVGRSGRPQMIHGFAAEYAGQTRGYSRLSHALQEFQNLTDFSSAQIHKAINQSQVWVSVKPSMDAAASNPFEDITNIPAGPASHQFGSHPTPPADAKNVTPESINPIDFHEMPAAFSSQPGSWGVFGLNRGEDLKPFINTAPADSFDKFVDSFAAYLSAATGVPVEMMLMRFGENYSASRAALILFWRIARIWQHEMAVDFLDVLTEAWLSEEIAMGRISAPGWSDPVLRAAWMRGIWHGVALPNIDPVRTAKANLIDVKELGAKTHDMVAREVSGSDGKSNRAKITKELQEMPQAS